MNSTRQLVASLFPPSNENPDSMMNRAVDFFNYLQHLQKAGDSSFWQALLLVLQSSPDEILLLEVEQVIRDFLPELDDNIQLIIKDKLVSFNHEIAAALLQSDLLKTGPSWH